MVNHYTEHQRLFSDTGLKLGKALYYLLRADHEMDSKRHVDTPSGTVRTKFGEEVGKDEIYWWIYKKETNVRELLGKVSSTLVSLQILKESSSKLDSSDIKSYADLVGVLEKFTESHGKQIDDLYEFVVWLHKKDPLAPMILFTYRVWGSTRRSDRRIELDSVNLATAMPEVIKLLTEIAYGLFQRWNYVRHRVMMDIRVDMYDRDPENYHAQEIPEGWIVSRTANKVLREFAIFFEELRDSLRNIELDIEKYLAEKDLLKSESFWRDFIIKSKTPGRTESMLWDFKESLEMWHAPRPQRAKFQVDFSNLVGAFANNEGGVIVVGVTNDTRAIVGVEDPENKMKSIGEVIYRWVDYPRKDALFHLQPVPFDENGKLTICLVVAVAQTAEVVRVRGESNQYYYPDRVQTGVAYPEPRTLETRKMHLKAGDNFGFIKELAVFVYDK